jgi:hypothetical protein
MQLSCGVVLGYHLMELDVVRVGVRGVVTGAAKSAQKHHSSTTIIMSCFESLLLESHRLRY